ncbi:hypothetical protein OIE50_50845 [Streptomyces canus]|uniref:hypothetical protein n=1 Tax=Streptomyces canus TaxID=58343 RepID=UPI00324675B0
MTDSRQPITEDETPEASEIARVRPAVVAGKLLEENFVPGSDAPAVVPPPSPPTHEDWTRRIIAWGLLGLVAVLVGAGTWAFVTDKAFTDQDLEQLGVFVSPLIALAAAAFGFYFGAGERDTGKR